MYQLIYADDEDIMRDSISNIIDWQKYGFDLVGVCANGHDLVEMAERVQPDLVILDINMPFIDGITAARLIKEEVPHAKLVFLTGYDNFNYAQKAVELNVLKYILKPVTAAAISGILSEIRDVLDKEGQEKADYRQLKDFYEQNAGIMKRAFFDMLLEGLLAESEAAAKIATLALDALMAGPFLSAIILCDQAKTVKGTETDESAFNLLTGGIYNIVEEELTRGRFGVVALKGDRIAVIFCCRKDGETLIHSAAACLERIRQIIRDLLKITVTIGVGKEYANYSGISHSYNEAASALAYRYTQGGDRLIFISDIEPNRQPIKVFDHRQEIRLKDAIKSGNPTKINELTEYMFSLNGSDDFHRFRVYALSVIVSLSLEAERLGFSSDIFLAGADIRPFFLEETPRMMIKKVREACVLLSQMIGNQQKSSRHNVFEETVRLIEENISDVNLSADRICEELHFSPSYFRALFRKEAGMSFGAYLTQTRMEKAKQLLLETDEKGYMIAQRVGFSDSRYFSFCFKKYFHVAPKEMRGKHRVISY